MKLFATLWSVACLVVLSGAGAAGAAAPDGFYIGPYVTEVGTVSALIHWVTAGNTEAGTVTIVGTGVSAVATVAALPGRPEQLHTAAIKGLKPLTRHTYEISCAGRTVQGSFTTAPDGGEPIRFVAYGDTRSRPDMHRVVAGAIAREEPMFVLHSGDLVANGDNWDDWKQQFFDPARDVLRASAIRTARGNHEASGVWYQALFHNAGGPGSYSFDFGDLHCVVLDRYADKEKMIEWLKEDLAANRAAWIIAMYHEPTFNVGGHGSQWGETDVLPVLERYEVDMVLTGHSHIYERFLPIGPAGRKPIIHVVTGGGGAPLYGPVDHPLLAGGSGEGVEHYCLIEIDGSRFDMTVKTPQGEVIDRLSLTKKDGRYQDMIMSQAVETRYAVHAVPMARDLRVDLDGYDVPGGPVTVTLALDGSLKGSTMTFGQAPAGEWRVAEQTVVLENGRPSFTAIPPPGKLTVGAEFRPDPPLSFAMSWTADGMFLFVSDDIMPPINDSTLLRIVPDPKPHDVRYSRQPITVDGDVADWSGIPVMRMPLMHDQSSNVKLCWREEGLYGVMCVADSEVKVNAEAPWEADSLELFVEKKRIRYKYLHKKAGRYAFSPAPDRGPGAGHIMIVHGVNKGRPDNSITCSWQTWSRGYKLEFFLPADVLGRKALTHGREMGLNFTINDNGVPTEQFYCDKNRQWYCS